MTALSRSKLGIKTDYRKFNGRTFYLEQLYDVKSQAEGHAERSRARGRKARVVKIRAGVYAVFLNKLGR